MTRARSSPSNTITDAELLTRLRDSAERRASLWQSGASTAVRLVHDTADALPGIVVERFADLLIVQHHEGRALARVDQLRAAMGILREECGARSVYLKRFLRDRTATSAEMDTAHHDSTPWIGDACPEEFPIREHELSLLVRPFDGFSTGLFLEHRDNRRGVRELAGGKTVLNLFAYTCGFSVAAAAGGATEVTSVDLSARYLDWGRRNVAANGLDDVAHRYICDDAINFLGRARRQGRDYDLIVIDPPTFARRKRPKGVFALAERLDALLSTAAERLRPGGMILFATNARRITRRTIETACRNAAAGRRIRSLDWLPLPPDFRGDPDYSRAVLTAVE